MTETILRCDVLLVEDDVDLSALMASYLARGGLDVRTAHSGSSAFRLLETVQPKVAVLDFRLPDMNGVELSQKIRQLVPDLRIIMMSGAIDPLDQKTLETIGVRVFVNKPVPLRSLQRAVVQLMQEHS
jgi:two-component system, OmpR family, response regulator CpxR